MTLNLQHHLKRPEEAWERTLEGLEDENVRAGRRLSLWMRAEKLAAAKGNSFSLEEIVEKNRIKLQVNSLFSELINPLVCILIGFIG